PEVGGQPLYGREEYVRRLSSSLAHTKQSRLYFLFGPRKIGKTSILNFVAAEVRNQAAGHLCVYVDFERKWTQGSPVTHIVEQILRAAKRAALPLEGFDLPPPQSIGQLEDWLESFKAATKINHFVLMLDEFFTLIKHLKDNDDSGFLGDLRYLWSRVHLVSLVLADWHSVEEMSDCVPAQFWADIDDIDVGFLDEAATRQAMRGPASNSKIEFTDEASNEIYALTRGYSWHVQQICDYAVREAVRDLRCNILKSDIQLAAERLIDEPRTFKQGLFRPDRISPEEEILLWKLCKCTDAYETWVPKSLVNEQEPPLNSINQWKSLVLKSVLQESGGSVRLCSPLVYSWLIRQFEEGKQISSMSLPEGIALPKLKGCLLERDVHTQILRLVTDLINYKRKLKDACRLYTLDSPFKHEDYAEIESLKVLVNSADTWNTFIGALKLLMVDDLRMSVDSLETTPYTILAKILHQVRLRRNYVEHPDNPSKWARIVELQHRKSDITKDDPRLPDDWTRLQIGLLQRTIRALALQLATLEEQHAQAVTA
ncbi:MAG TPA: ATP-binding protein, partial [Candidatus Obscuribacterales bacterium]